MGVLLTRLMVSTCVTRLVAVYFVLTFRCAVYPCILGVFLGIGALSEKMFCNPNGSVRFMGNDNGL